MDSDTHLLLGDNERSREGIGLGGNAMVHPRGQECWHLAERLEGIKARGFDGLEVV